jgi:hypothetical protein
MTNEWMQVMLEEISRKQEEEKQARIEQELRRSELCERHPASAPAVVLQCTKAAVGE